MLAWSPRRSRARNVWVAAHGETPSGQPMARQVTCERGYIVRDDDEHRVVALARQHIGPDHPELLDVATPEIIRTWIEVTP